VKTKEQTNTWKHVEKVRGAMTLWLCLLIGSAEVKSAEIIFLGPPGSGKGTQSNLLSQKLKIPQISTGDLLRERAQAGDLEIAKVLEKGGTISEGKLETILTERLSSPDAKQGWILDGCPRTLAHVRILNRVLTALGRSENVDAVISLEVPDSVVHRRLAKRQICSRCGKIYNQDSLAPKTKGVCDLCHNPLYHRSDDLNHDVVINRLNHFKNETSLVLDFYQRSGRLCRVSGVGPKPEVFGKILKCQGIKISKPKEQK